MFGVRFQRTVASSSLCALLVSLAGCVEGPERDPDEVSAILVAISDECELAPYILKMNDSGEVVWWVPSNVSAMRPTEEMTKCAQDRVFERLKIRMAP